MIDEETISKKREVVDGIIPEKYKHYNHTIDIAGSENKPIDCYIEFAVDKLEGETEYKIDAMEMANKINSLQIGVGYLNIVFQADDWSYAVATVDLSTQNPSEISVKIM